VFETELLDEFKVYPELQTQRDLEFESVVAVAKIGEVAVGQYVFNKHVKGTEKVVET